MEEKTLKQVETPSMASLQEWLESNEIDHPDYPQKFAESKRLEEEIYDND